MHRIAWDGHTNSARALSRTIKSGEWYRLAAKQGHANAKAALSRFR